MTSRPRLHTASRQVYGLAAAALFVVLVAVFLTAGFDQPSGFAGEGSITASIGYAMFNLGSLASFQSEGFLVTFEIIDLVLVAALVGAVMLGKREKMGGGR